VIFINDMDDTVEHLTSILRKFADDTKLGKKVRTDKERQELQEALDKLCHWADRWGMEFNVSKCKVMHMGHSNQKHDYYMNGQQLEKSEEERDIGVMITSNLKPSAQCAKAARRLRESWDRSPGHSTTGTDMCLCGCTSSMSGHTWSSPPRHGPPGQRRTSPAWRKCSSVQ
jgi:hypothetical protein